MTPAQCAPYFSKIQCFCFEEQRLNAGETVDMPVFFYLDPDLLNDMNMKGVETVTLSYTFFSKFYRSCYDEKESANPVHRSKIRQQRTVPKTYVEIVGTCRIKCILCMTSSTCKIYLLHSGAITGHIITFNRGCETWMTCFSCLQRITQMDFAIPNVIISQYL